MIRSRYSQTIKATQQTSRSGSSMTSKGCSRDNSRRPGSIKQRRCCVGISRLTMTMMMLGAIVMLCGMNLVRNNYSYINDSIHKFLAYYSFASSRHSYPNATYLSQEDDNDEELPHVVYDDLKYRRVCSDVYRSVLCMTIRFPFPVPLQDPTVAYPNPVDDLFYNLTELIMIDEHLLDECRYRNYANNDNNNNNNNPGITNATVPMRERIYQCLEKKASEQPNTVVAVYTRQVQGQPEEDWFGTRSAAQQERFYKFFHQHAVLVLGASMSRYITNCVSLLGNCLLTPKASFRCQPPGSNKLQDDHPTPPSGHQGNINKDKHVYDISEAGANSTWLGYVYYKPDGAVILTPLVNSTPPLLEMFRTHGVFAGPAWTTAATTTTTKLRPMSILVDFPMAHTQHHTMIQSNLAEATYNQKRMVELIMNITTPQAQLELAELGFSLDHLIVFDGVPQHFPTETGAYAEMRHFHNSSEFLQWKGYPGWHEELGSSCRGPLPPNSPSKYINSLSRQAFARTTATSTTTLKTTTTTTTIPTTTTTTTTRRQMDSRFAWDATKWYGKIWEFSNQFWWQEKMWESGSLDCTHPRHPIGGAPCAHKYFLQAMIDSYYEEEEQGNAGDEGTPR